MSREKNSSLYPEADQIRIMDAGYNQIDDENEIIASNQFKRM